MKKLIALTMVCAFAFAFVACGGGAKNEEAQDTTVVTPEPTPADTIPADTTAADTTAN